MTAKYKLNNPILVTGAVGAVGGVGRNVSLSSSSVDRRIPEARGSLV